MDTAGTSGVFARRYDELGRAVEMGFAGGRVIAVSFPAEPPADADGDHELLDRVGGYLRGERDEFTEVTVGLTVPTAQRDALEALRTVPYAESVSVSRLTRLAGFDSNDPDDLDAVTEALAANPVPVLVPDHRGDGVPYATPSDVRAALRRARGP